MQDIDNFFTEYLRTISEGMMWTNGKRFYSNDLIEYWIGLTERKLGKFGFRLQVRACDSPIQDSSFYDGEAYSSHNNGHVTVFVNKGELAKRFGLDDMPKKFDDISQAMAKTLNLQIVNAKYERMSQMFSSISREMDCLRQTSLIAGIGGFDPGAALQPICSSLAEAMQHPEYAMVRICYGDKQFKTRQFDACGVGLSKSFSCPGNVECSIEVYYKPAVREIDSAKDLFLDRERELLEELAAMIKGAATAEALQNLQESSSKRMQELMAINQATAIIKEGRDIDYTLQKICDILPGAMLHHRYAVARIRFDGKEYRSDNFIFTHRSISEQFVTIDNNKGSIEVFYTKQFAQEYKGAFLEQECSLITNLARLAAGYINDIKGRDIIHKTISLASFEKKEDHFRRRFTENHKPLQNYFNQQMLDKYIYLDMMKFKVKHVLFVATLYDAFCIENEDSFFGRFMGDVHQFSLYTMPRITGVSTPDEALEAMESSSIDMVIIMPSDMQRCRNLSERLKQLNGSAPIYLLINKKEDVRKYQDIADQSSSIDKVYTWNGDSNIFFTIVKTLEDSINVNNDTEVGLVKVILLIEDSAEYYSRYLEILFSTVFGQVAQIIPEVEKNELDKIVKMRSRPKILHARNYEEAISIYNKYKDNLMCVISDIEFEWGGQIDRQAGLKLVKHIRSEQYTVPVIFQSTEELSGLDPQIYNQEKVFFINKNSKTLLDDLKRYLIKYLGFGEFIFKNLNNEILGYAHSLREFETMLKEMPAESIYRHAVKNQFSIWLMGRGEIQLAKIFREIPCTSLESAEKVRPELIKAINTYRAEKKRGKILSYDETSSIDERNIITLAPGSLGGKGRGVAFIDTVIYNLENSPLSDRINIWSPVTLVIGTEEFTSFIARNSLYQYTVDKSIPYDDLKLKFWNSRLSDTLRQRLSVIIGQTDNPLAIRSSSTSEDSASQPFAGVFSTFIIPNEKGRKEYTLELACHAVKLIYASMYSDTARSYYETVKHNIEEEKMAIVIQEVVGSRFGNYFYPHISGVAQSYNFYPMAGMKPEEGYAVAGVGLGCYVVGGYPCYRFSPKYPSVQMYTKNDLLKSTQTKFFALDLSLQDVDLLKNGELAALKFLSIYDAEKHGALKHLASVYNRDNDTITAGLDGYGARIVNFADILQYDYFPLAETIDMILNVVKDAFGSAVEIEYAVNLNKAKNGKPTFYLLQIKPMVGSFEQKDIRLDEIASSSKALLYTNQSLGNGTIDNISDVIFVKEDKFDKLQTVEMERQINYLNTVLGEEKRKYVLIGPGRWGTSDRFLGVPVAWSEISNAAVIIETSLDGYPLDFSHGSHFFHNITSMNIGYFAIKKENPKAFIKRDILEHQEVLHETTFFKHVRFCQPLKVLMNGSKNESAIEMG